MSATAVMQFVSRDEGEGKGMRRIFFGFLLAIVTAAVLAMPVAAGVDQNPNVFEAKNLVCNNGFTSDILLIVGRTGHVPPGTSGVATKVEVLISGVWVSVFDVPGTGLDARTTACTWSGGGLDFRGEIVLRGNLR